MEVIEEGKEADAEEEKGEVIGERLLRNAEGTN